jgi:hypothetical protein
MRQHQFILALGKTLSLMFCLDAAAQDAGPVQYAIPQDGHQSLGVRADYPSLIGWRHFGRRCSNDFVCGV